MASEYAKLNMRNFIELGSPWRTFDDMEIISMTEEEAIKKNDQEDEEGRNTALFSNR
jgi:hypothetical protein